MDEPAEFVVLRPMSDRASESPIHELLVCLLSCFDDGTEKLHKDVWAVKGKAMGYITDDSEWDRLKERFGKRQGAYGAEANPPPTAANVLDLGLVGSYFSNKHGEVIQELMRRITIGLARNEARTDSLEERLAATEAVLDRTVLQAERDRHNRAQAVLRRWKHQHTSVAFDGWVRMTAENKAKRRRIAGHWANALVSRCFVRWHGMLAEQSEMRARARQSVQRWANRFVAGAFGAWRDAVREKVDARESQYLKTLGRMANRLLAMGEPLRHWPTQAAPRTCRLPRPPCHQPADSADAYVRSLPAVGGVHAAGERHQGAAEARDGAAREDFEKIPTPRPSHAKADHPAQPPGPVTRPSHLAQLRTHPATALRTAAPSTAPSTAPSRCAWSTAS